jgi:exonuclease III
MTRATCARVDRVLDDHSLDDAYPGTGPRSALSGLGEWEYDFYRAFGQAGFDDAFRIKEPSAMDYSWFGWPSADGKRNGYRFDHAFVSRAHRTVVVRVGMTIRCEWLD